MKKDLYILYILHFKKIKSFKIGITNYNRFDVRMKEIEKDFGKINLSQSAYVTSSSMNNIKKIESSLHSIFWQFSKEQKKGSGKTEFFNDIIRKDLFKVLKAILLVKKLKITGPYSFSNKKNFFFYFSIFIILSGSIGYYLLIIA